METEVQETETADDFAGNEMMADLAAAWDAAEEKEDANTGAESGEVFQSAEQPEGADHDPASGSNPKSEDAPAGTDIPLDEKQDGSVNQLAEGSEKPPVGLSAAAREVWKDTPKEIRDELAKRENDYARGIQKYAEGAKRAAAMDRTLQPYQQLFAMNGGAAETMPGILQTASILQMGAPVQKAQMVANLIKQFGVDIKTLDSMLVGEAPPPEAQAQSEIQRAVAEAVAPYQQHMQQIQQQQRYQQERGQQEVASEVQQFSVNPANEFYHDVRAEMADILDLAANRGREMTMQEAYDQACQLNPQIRQILASRHSQQAVTTKRRAGSSIHGTMGGDGMADIPGSMRDAIETAWENSGRT